MIFILLVFLAAAFERAAAQTRVSIGVTEPFETFNPYGDSSGLLYGIWSEITGPFCIYNYEKGEFEGRLAERWKAENPTTWIFYLNKSYKFSDGTPVTAADVVHSMMNRVINDPQSKQKASVAGPIIKAEAVDNNYLKKPSCSNSLNGRRSTKSSNLAVFTLAGSIARSSSNAV